MEGIDTFPDWRCSTCGLISSGSVANDSGDKVTRWHCRYCQTLRPNLTGWRYVEDGNFYEEP